jgi:predicted ATPase/DNA-binding CsgD family transcriptional regulator
VLPVDLTSFVGRRHEVAEIKDLLTDHRLLTVTGVGGVGKTRVALRTAEELRRRFADGVAWVELADLRDPGLLAQTIEDALPIPNKVDRDPLVNLENHLAHRAPLIVLDNAEHVLRACADTVAHLLRTGSSLKVLVTSRQALGVPGERVYGLSPLPVPDAASATDEGAGVAYAALALFEERAAESLPGFTLNRENQVAVAEICRRLEGIPLAIELATVRLRVLSVDDLRARLTARLECLGQGSAQVPPRHRSLQATIDWSYELCTPSEQLLWARASVFAGGFTIGAAEACCADSELPQEGVIDALAGLVDKSILARSEPRGHVRFRLLEPLREHGMSQLAARSETALAKDRHLDWCANLVDEACMQWFGPAQERWCVTLHLEKANVRAAAEHCLLQPDRVERALRLLGEPWFLWVALFLDEGQHWLGKALAQSTAATPARARALATAGYVAALQGEPMEAEAFLDESRKIATTAEDAWTLAYGAHVRGVNALFSDPVEAVRRLREALELYQEIPQIYDDYPVSLRTQLGLALLFSGDLEAAVEQSAICRELCTVAGEKWLLSYALYVEAFVAYLRAQHDLAADLVREAVGIKKFFGDSLGVAVSLDLLAWIRGEQSMHEEAAVLLGAAAGVWATIGPALFGSEHWLALRTKTAEQASGVLGQSKYDAAYARGTSLDEESAVAWVLREASVDVDPEVPCKTPLTPREGEVADLVAEGLSNKAISERLVIAQRTAEGHVENILTKLGFRSRTQIAAWVMKSRNGE